MQSAPYPANESRRLETLHSYAILGTDAEASYDDLVELTAYICNTPIALISLIDKDRQWFKARVGLTPRETHRDLAFCAHAILSNEVMVVEDTLTDVRFADNPLVLSEPGIRFYAGAPLISRDGYGLGTLCAIDTRPRKLSDIQLTALKTLAEQTRVQLELRRQSFDLEQLVEKQNRLFKILGHDLRDPFHTVREHVEVIRDYAQQRAEPGLLKLTRKIEAAAQLAGGLVENLLTWSLLESGELPFAAEMLRSHAAMHQASEYLADRASAKGMQISVGGDELPFRADPKMLHSMLCNLLSNAIKFSPRGSEIRLNCQARDDCVEFAVRDRGIGIAPHRVSGLSDFQNLSTLGTELETGTGLGLQLCYGFARRHSGTLRVESEPGVGSTFTISLPVAPA